MANARGKNPRSRYYLPQVSGPFTLLLMHRFFLITFLGLSASLMAAKPNVVILFTDDQGTLDANCYGSKDLITPNIDRLASEGRRFTDAHSPSSVCTPTRYGVLTGRYCWRSRLKGGVLYGESPNLIRPGRLTLASLLKQHRYEKVSPALSKSHLVHRVRPLIVVLVSN